MNQIRGLPKQKVIDDFINIYSDIIYSDIIYVFTFNT